ncbi:MAG TPA: hypothetical protein VN213_20455 [Solirubrobacteraceae bacterium]|nr:hypothetical protein [Solirubrobacteraceae bacterium]
MLVANNPAQDVTADSTTFVEGDGTAEAVHARMAQIRAELAGAVHERDVEILQSGWRGCPPTSP